MIITIPPGSLVSSKLSTERTGQAKNPWLPRNQCGGFAIVLMMKPAEPPVAQCRAKCPSDDGAGFPRSLWALVETLARQLPESGLREATLRLIRERAPDEQLALAFLTKLLEQTPIETTQVLREPACAFDLVFCLGASE